MCAKLLGFLLFACLIISNRSEVVHEITESMTNFTSKSTPALSTLPEGYVRFPDVHAAYKVYKKSATWVQARDLCIAEGARLAVTDTVEKIEHVYAMQPEVDDWISVGIQKSNTTDDWVRIDDGRPLTSIPWSEDNPDDAGPCVAISFSGNSLVNFYCDVLPVWYVCEISK